MKCDRLSFSLVEIIAVRNIVSMNELACTLVHQICDLHTLIASLRNDQDTIRSKEWSRENKGPISSTRTWP
jgi:hypothetical protein